MTHNNTPPPGNRGRFEVWHRLDEGFIPVALVSIGNLLGALVLTLSRKDAHWETFDEVSALLPNRRSTTIGDVIISPENNAYEIRSTPDGLVFTPVDLPPHRERQALFAEWRADYVAAEARDPREQFREMFGGTNRLSEAPDTANDKHKDRDSGIER